MSELIAAVATAAAPSGVGIVRLSGDGAGVVAGRVFRPKSGRMLTHYRDRQLIFGEICDKQGAIIDQGLAFYARGPHSYTGEETAEIHCHGSPMVLSLVLEALFSAGARQALPGEFTKRAFLNGRLDLMQAEAVIDLIEAETPGGARLAASQLHGTLSWRVEELYSGLVDILAHYYAVLDYPDEEIDPFREETIRAGLEEGLRGVEALLATYDRGRRINYGVPCAIIGRPNVGKSSLLNLLAGYERAIVTNVPGTTRDTIEEKVTLGGVLLRLIDTAGLRETQDTVEQLGVSRSRQAAQEAELALLVLDSSQPLTQEDREAINLAKEVPACICVLNKTDLPQRVDAAELEGNVTEILHFSAKTGEGLSDLSQAVGRLFPLGDASGGQACLSNARQKDGAERARQSLLQARESLCAGQPPDLVLHDVETAMAALGELSGKTLREDITNRIFERFCVGK